MKLHFVNIKYNRLHLLKKKSSPIKAERFFVSLLL